MEKCWNDDEDKRPDFKEIVEEIKKMREIFDAKNK
jgi:hypothetical protein